MVSTAAFHTRVRGSFPGIGGLKETKMFLPHPLVKTQYCGEPPWPRGSVLGLDLQVCISNPVSGWQCHLTHLTILGKFPWPNLARVCAQKWPKARFISFQHSLNWARGTSWDGEMNQMTLLFQSRGISLKLIETWNKFVIS